MNIRSFLNRSATGNILRAFVMGLALLGASGPMVLADHMGNHQRPHEETTDHPDTGDGSTACGVPEVGSNALDAENEADKDLQHQRRGVPTRQP